MMPRRAPEVVTLKGETQPINAPWLTYSEKDRLWTCMACSEKGTPVQNREHLVKSRHRSQAWWWCVGDEKDPRSYPAHLPNAQCFKPNPEYDWRKGWGDEESSPEHPTAPRQWAAAAAGAAPQPPPPQGPPPAKASTNQKATSKGDPWAAAAAQAQGSNSGKRPPPPPPPSLTDKVIIEKIEQLEKIMPAMTEASHKLQEVKCNVETMQEELQSNTAKAEEVKSNVEELKSSMVEVKSSVAEEMKSSTTEATRMLQELMAKLQEVKCTVETMQEELQSNTAKTEEVKSSMEELKSNMQELKSNMEELKSNREELEWQLARAVWPRAGGPHGPREHDG